MMKNIQIEFGSICTAFRFCVHFELTVLNDDVGWPAITKFRLLLPELMGTQKLNFHEIGP